MFNTDQTSTQIVDESTRLFDAYLYIIIKLVRFHYLQFSFRSKQSNIQRLMLSSNANNNYPYSDTQRSSQTVSGSIVHERDRVVA